MALQHLRSSTANKRPDPTAMAAGQLALNSEATSPGLFFKNSSGNLVKVGPVHVGTTAPNATPASGGTAGNSVGEQWLDTSGTNPIFKIWTGSTWASENGEFVNASGDTMTGALVMDNQQQVRFRETTANGTNYIAIQAPASVATDKTLTLPDANGTLVSTGDTGTVTSTMIADGTIVNGDINASAAIAGTKINPDFGSQNVTTTGTVSGASLNPTSTTIPTNGIYVPATNAIGISTAGVIRQSISGTGSVTYVPVTVQGTVTGDSFVPTSSTAPSNGVYLPAANSVAISTNGSGRLFVDSSGRVGIGVSSPVSSLDIRGSATNFDGIRIVNTNPSSGTATTAALRLGITNSIGVRNARIEAVENDADSNDVHLDFYTNTANSVDGETVKMRLTSGGRLGIGTTTVNDLLHVKGGTIRAESSSSLTPGVSLIGGGPDQGWLKFGTTAGDYYSIKAGADYLGMLFFTNGTERARIDSSGRLLVGTSSARANFFNGTNTAASQIEGTGSGASASRASLSIINNNSNTGETPYFILGKSSGSTIGSNTLVANNEYLGIISFQGNDGSEFVEGASIHAQVDGTPGANDLPTRLVFSTTADGASSPTERMRINNNGWTYINTTSDPTVDAAFLGVVGNNSRPAISAVGGTGPWAIKVGTTDTGATRYILGVCNNSSATLGGITTNGTVITYGGTSDYRLKENIAPVSNALATLALLKPVTFTWKTTGAIGNGFIAHELQEVFPDAVAGEKDATETDGSIKPQMVDQSKLVSVLTAALQEAVAKIEVLEAKVAALEAA